MEMKLTFFGFFMVVLLFSSCDRIQEKANIQQEEHSIDLASLEQQIDSLLAPYNNPSTPGCGLTIFLDGKPVIRRDVGMASIEFGVPFSHNSVVTMPYSEAREFISIASILMENDGIINLNDKVQKYFPLLPAWSEPVTIMDLLNHRSGFVDEWATLLLSQNAMSNRFETPQFLRLLYNQTEPEVEPGKGYMYCNSDFGLLRLILEKASGEKLPDWMDKRMFKPLKMNNTQMQRNALDIVPKHAENYAEGENEGYERDHVQKTSPGGNYFIMTTTNDLEIWWQTMSDPSSEISKVSRFLLDHIRIMPGKPNHIITGYTKQVINGDSVIFHEGVNGYNYLSRIPNKGLAVITLANTNRLDYSDINESIINNLLKVPPPIFPVLKSVPIQVSALELKKYEGNYRWLDQVSWEGMNQTRRFSSYFVEGGKLKVRFSGNYVIELMPVGKDLFYYSEGYGAQFEFDTPNNDAPMRVKVTYDDGFPGLIMEKDSVSQWLPSKEILASFVGKYYSKHLDYFWNIAMGESGGLVIKRYNLPDVEMKADGLNQFHYLGEKYVGAAFDSWILFNKDKDGKISGFTVWSERVMHHRFDRIII